MKSVSRIALGVALALGGASVIATAPATAKKKPEAAQPSAANITLTKEERAVLAPVQTAITEKDWATAQAGMPAAIAAANSPGGRYAIGRFARDRPRHQKRRHAGSGAGNLIASGKVESADLPTIYRTRAFLRTTQQQGQGRSASQGRRAQPQRCEALISLAQVKNSSRSPPKRAAHLPGNRNQARRRQTVDESWYKYALKLAFDGRTNPALREASQEAEQELVTLTRPRRIGGIRC